MVQVRAVAKLVVGVPVKRQLHANPVVPDMAKVGDAAVERIAKDE
jgi:hypothetical protein